jgi:hypothetical protein
MELLDTIIVEDAGQARTVQLYLGDLVSLAEDEAVDVLVVSAFPGDYTPISGTLIGNLHRVGVSVADLARDMAVDLRSFSSCWLSRPLERPDLHIVRILCFEPAMRGRAPEVVGDVFRSIIPLMTGDPPLRRIAMPLLAAGDQGESPLVMLEALAEASVQWLSSGLSIDCIRIVARPKWAGWPELRETFARIKERHPKPTPAPSDDFLFDAFISYSHQDKDAVDVLLDDLRSHRPGLRAFVDRLELKPGFSWQQHIFESLDASRKVISVLSPDYVASKVCQEEFNIALLRQRESPEGVLLPVYLRTAHLPTYMRLHQWEDAREKEGTPLAEVARRLAEQL